MTPVRWFLSAAVLAASLLSVALVASGPDGFAQVPRIEKEKKGGPKDKDGPKGKEKDRFDPKGKDKKEPKDKDGPKGARHFRHAYETLSEVSLLAKATGDRLPRDTGRLLDSAKEMYRAALKARRDGDGRRADELAHAANDAGRGLRHLLRASLPAPADLPAPTAASAEGDQPWSEARDVLTRAHERIREVADDEGPAKEFAAGSRQLYSLARKAYLDGDYARAEELARGAEAWTHAGEHLRRSGEVARAEPGPMPKALRAPPPPPEVGAERDPPAPRRPAAPPPPPALD